MNLYLSKLKNLEINDLLNLNNYSPNHHVKVKNIFFSFLTLTSVAFIASVGCIICSLILSQPLFLICLLITTALFSITLGITLHLLHKYLVPKVPLDAVKNFLIKEKTPNSFTIEVFPNNNSSKTITFISKSPEYMLKSKSFYKKTDPFESRTGYICTTNKEGTSNFSPEGTAINKKFNLAWRNAKKNDSFSISEVKTSPIFLSQKHSSYHINEKNIPTDIYSNHLHIFLCFSHTIRSSLNSFYKDLKTSYKNIFAIVNKKNIKTLYLPILGINTLILESKTLAHYKATLASKTLLECLFKEISNQTSVDQWIIFTDKNSIIEEIIWEKHLNI